MENFTGDIKQTRFWVENERGEKTAGDGTVKMEYDADFFGKNLEELQGDDQTEKS